MAKIIKEIDWNGNHYTFENSFKHTGTKSHDILTMTDQNGNEWTGETVWINRPWHRFDLEEAFTEIVSKAFGPKAEQLILEINKTAYNVEGAIVDFFAQFKPEDIEVSSNEGSKSFTEVDRIEALAEYLGVDSREIEHDWENEFEVNGETYAVLTDEEAEEEFDNYARSLYEESDFDSLSDMFGEWFIDSVVDKGALEDAVREDIEYVVYEYDDEETISECINYGIVEEDEVYDEEGNIKEDVDVDYLKDSLIDAKVEDVDDPVEYFKDMGLDDSFFEQYVDEDDIILAIKDAYDANGDGRGVIASYDGHEEDLGNGLFIYRIN